MAWGKAGGVGAASAEDLYTTSDEDHYTTSDEEERGSWEIGCQ
jgi:hypothetical protein